jgi:hypothetical protein
MSAVGVKGTLVSNIEPRRRTEYLPAARPTPPLPTSFLRSDDLERIPVLSRRDMHVDRRNAARHVIAVRDLQRQAVEGAAIEAGRAFVQAAAVEARRRVLTEAKFQLHRARKESQILADDDLELAAKFAQLDDDFFASVRLLGEE